VKRQLMLALGVLLIFGLVSHVAVAADVIEISVQDVWSDSLMWGRVWLQTIKEFEEANPDIKINRIYVPLGQNIERILLQTKTRSLPDIITVDIQDVPHLAEMGSLLDLTPFIEKWGHWDDVLPRSREAMSWNGNPYVIQFTTNTLALHYNKDLFEEAGLTRPPATWEELREWAEKLTKPEKGQYGFAYSAYYSEEATCNFLPFLWSNGGDLLDLDAPESIEALEFVTSFVRDGYTPRDIVNWNQGDVGVQFRLGNVAMMVQGCWDIPLSEEENMNFGVAVLPTPDGSVPTVPIGGEAFGMSPFSSPEKQEAAWRFLEYLMSEEVMARFNARVYNIPTRISVGPSVIEEKPLLEPFVLELQNGRSRSEAGGVKYPNISIATREAIQKVIIGQATPEEAFKEAAKKVEEILAE